VSSTTQIASNAIVKVGEDANAPSNDVIKIEKVEIIKPTATNWDVIYQDGGASDTPI
jgi:hypothetical protein